MVLTLENLDKMNKEFLHMQKLAGLITESEYKEMLNDDSDWRKDAQKIMNNSYDSYDTLDDAILDMHDALNYGVEDEDEIYAFFKKYDA